MDALSPWTYGRRNVRKNHPTVNILTFVVMLVVVILSTLAGLRESTLVYTREFDEWTLVFPASLRPRFYEAFALFYDGSEAAWKNEMPPDNPAFVLKRFDLGTRERRPDEASQ